MLIVRAIVDGERDPLNPFVNTRKNVKKA